MYKKASRTESLGFLSGIIVAHYFLPSLYLYYSHRFTILLALCTAE